MSAQLERVLRGRAVVASVSGGKDSAALSLWLTEKGIEHERVFFDTGWEHNSTYEYLRGDLERAIGPIVWLTAERQMEALILWKAMFPSRQRRFCTQELKVFPMQAYLNNRVDAGEELVNAVGIRAEESQERALLKEWEWSDGFDCEVWRPLIDWTEQQVIDLHKRHGLRPNPLYLKGALRVGCWPCINARKSEIRLIADTDPERIAKLRELEERVGVAARARYERDRAKWIVQPDPEPAVGSAAHERWEAKRDRLMRPFEPPTWFQAQTKNGEGRYPTMPIDEVVKWSRTSYGGKQFELFASDRDGCVRWGLCETRGGA